MLRTILLPALAVVLLAACAKNETVPAYVQVKDFTLTDTLGHPIQDQEITDVWVFRDGQFVGTFGLPTREPGIPVPVFEGQPNRIRLYPGVKADRIEQQRVQYPFYDADTSLMGLLPTQTYKVNLNGTARARLSRLIKDPVLNEGFESGNSFSADVLGSDLERALHSATPDVTPPPDGGSYYARRRYSGLSTAEFLTMVQTVPMRVPTVRRELYLECQYRSSVYLAAGIRASRSNAPSVRKTYQQLILNPSLTWKKVYIYLYDEVFAASTAADGFDQIQIMFTSDSAKQTSDFIAVDNLRLMEYR